MRVALVRPMRLVFLFINMKTELKWGVAAAWLHLTKNDILAFVMPILSLLFALLLNVLVPLPTAQAVVLPKPGTRVSLSPIFNPPLLKGIKVHPENPFKLEFILDPGERPMGQEQLKNESTRMVKYFLAALTTPEKDLWVNLSPYERDRIVPESFGQTEMGRDLLAQDYILKQITASLIYPEEDVGKKFWRRIYEEAAQKAGSTEVPVQTFNKVWIVPDKAVVYENAQTHTAYVVESHLKVLLEEDFLATQKNDKGALVKTAAVSQIVREVIIPQLNRELNEARNFTLLRQVYQSLILATWYKKKIKDSILTKVYANKNKIAGVHIEDPQDKEKIFQRYLQAFKTGAYNFIKEDIDPVTRQAVPRKYFSGGANLFAVHNVTEFVGNDNKAMVAKMEGLIQKILLPVVVTVALTVSGLAPTSWSPSNAKPLAYATQAPGPTGVPRYSPTDVQQISTYLIAYSNRQIGFLAHMPGEKFAKLLGFGEGFSNFYDEVRFRVFERRVKPEGNDMVLLFSQVLSDNTNSSPFERGDLTIFFHGIWSEYMNAAAMDTPHMEVVIEDLKYQAAKYSIDLAKEVERLLSLMNGISSRKNFTEAESKKFTTDWEKFNEEYMIPRGYYVDLQIWDKGREKRYHYISTVYKIDPTKTVTKRVSVGTVLNLYGVPIDRTSRPAPPGISMDTRKVVIYNLRDMEDIVRKIKETVDGKPFNLLSAGDPLYFAVVTQGVRQVYREMNENEIRSHYYRVMRAHEQAHQAWNMLRARYRGKDNFGLSVEVWKLKTKLYKQTVDGETFSILAQFLKSKDARSELDRLLVALFFNARILRDDNPHAVGARWIMNMLDGKIWPKWIDGNMPTELIAQYSRLFAVGHAGLQAKVREMIVRGWGQEFLRAIDESDSAMVIEKMGNIVPGDGVRTAYLDRKMLLSTRFFGAPRYNNGSTKTGGIDFKEDRMKVGIQNDKGAIQFKMDPAMLARFQDAPGFAPVITSVHTIPDLSVFLGLPE